MKHNLHSAKQLQFDELSPPEELDSNHQPEEFSHWVRSKGGGSTAVLKFYVPLSSVKRMDGSNQIATFIALIIFYLKIKIAVAKNNFWRLWNKGEAKCFGSKKIFPNLFTSFSNDRLIRWHFLTDKRLEARQENVE